MSTPKRKPLHQDPTVDAGLQLMSKTAFTLLRTIADISPFYAIATIEAALGALANDEEQWKVVLRRISAGSRTKELEDVARTLLAHLLTLRKIDPSAVDGGLRDYQENPPNGIKNPNWARSPTTRTARPATGPPSRVTRSPNGTSRTPDLREAWRQAAGAVAAALHGMSAPRGT